MKQWILDLVDKWLPQLPAPPVAVFDREGYDAGFFFRLVCDGRLFVSRHLRLQETIARKERELKSGSWLHP